MRRIVTAVVLLASVALGGQGCSSDRDLYGDGGDGFDADADVDADSDADPDGGDAADGADADDGCGADGECNASCAEGADPDCSTPDCSADGSCNAECGAGEDPDCAPPDCSADGECASACPPGEDPDCDCGAAFEACCETGCVDGHLCVADHGPPTCYEACEPSSCDYGGVYGFCLDFGGGAQGICAGVNMEPSDCTNGQRNCTTDYGVSTGTICIRSSTGDMLCYEYCEISSGGCEAPMVCTHVAAGGACMPI